MFELGNLADDKETRYKEMKKQLTYLLEGETNPIANLANTASLLYHYLGDVNWTGFYLMRQNELVLGPFMGKPACVRIAVGKGVCGTAVATNETQLVEDVHQFPGHIACDASSRSEIVIPLVVNTQTIGVLDIDSPSIGRFNHEDKMHLEDIVQILIKACKWEKGT